MSIAGRSCGEALIAEAERALEVTIPPTYRRFLREFDSLSLVGTKGIYVLASNGPIHADPSEVVS